KKSVITFWDELGVDGWRLDCGPDVSHEFWKEFRTCYKQLNPEGYVVGECWQHAGLWLQGDEWDGVMNYLWHDAVLSWARGGEVSSLDYKLRGIQGSYPEEAWRACLNLLGSHDTGRALTRLMDDKTRMKLAVIFQMTYPGVPCIYYGDEVGLTGGGDPECRKTYPWEDLGGNPDMQMFEHHKKLIEIRMRYPVLRTGSLKTLKVDDGAHIYVLGRKLGDQVAVLIYNNGSSAENVTVDLGELAPAGTKFIDVLNENREYTAGNGLTLTTDGMWANILIGTSKAREGVGVPGGLEVLPILGGILAIVIALFFILRKK
ncbi:MAG: alpha-amylase family glycosyl hydrolase, partial [Hadesarchaea archaeon]|nr:alpha-amylase family glycosyl hydrolase [Hadesarchaea archaeon]